MGTRGTSTTRTRHHEGKTTTAKTGTGDAKSTKATSSTVARDTKQPVKFDGKPKNVAHNPQHQDGSIAKLTDHKSMLVKKDGHYFKRSYYSGIAGGLTTWYWFDQPLSDDSPIIPALPYVATCSGETDDCQVIRRDVPPLEKNVIVNIWDYFTQPYTPVKVVPRCDAQESHSTGAVNGTTSCNNVAGSCSGTCELFDVTGAHVAGDSAKTAPVSPKVTGYTCKCAE